MRVKRGVTTHAKHNKIRKATKGMSKSNRSSVRRGKQAVVRGYLQSSGRSSADITGEFIQRQKKPQANI